ncbi:hypothetical protein [Serinibacter salmoneus]|uniref:Uncharacterized protein n=1 Tax=Serinibacter salmoneus TaxID=556530 RepID=A0A2A9D4C7_9MICO|nr:hypothetical protein [Serinibacter salmoneus]PFG21241.1 hypothetical protein ATL40_2864 [Serinibacter salmoneus]
MSATLDTHLTGSPDAIHAIASWLRTAGLRTEDHADAVARARSAAMESWTGNAATAFGSWSLTVTDGAGRIADTAQGLQFRVSTLAETLAGCLRALEGTRTRARAAGLSVSGTVIHAPSPLIGMPGGLSEEQLEALRAAHRALQAAWQEAQESTREALRRWQDAVEEFCDRTTSAREVLLGALAGLIEAVADTLGDAGLLDDVHPYPLVDPLGPRHLPDVDLSSLPDPPSGIRVPVLDVLLAAWSTKADMDAGEPFPQAVTSQGAAFAAGVGSGLVGSAAGTAIGGVGGAVAGAAIGTTLGTAAGTFANGFVDGLWEERSLGGAIRTGWEDLARLGYDLGMLTASPPQVVGEALGEALQATADTVLDCWDALFD